jgi:hypothetical protein
MADASPNMHFIPMTVAPGENVRPSRVVKMSELGDFCVEEAGVGDMPFGIAQEWTFGAPGTPFDDGFVSNPGNPAVLVYGPGSIAPAALKDNAPAIPPGKSVGPNADGEIVEVTSGWAVGWLMESGAATRSQKLRVFVFPHLVGAGSVS